MITDQVPDMKDYITGLFAELGINGASAIATKVLAKFGYNISVAAIIDIAQGVIFTLNWLNFDQVDKASNSGQNGILIEYLTNIGSGNARVYSTWSDERMFLIIHTMAVLRGTLGTTM